jgi:hypothetical protein
MHARYALLLLAALSCGCQPAPPPTGVVPRPDPAGFSGMYRKGAEWLDIGPMHDGYWVSIQSEACLFVGRARPDGDALDIALDDWRPGASLRVEHAGRGLLDIRPGSDDDRFDPGYFCRGDASLAGRYAPVTAPAHRWGRIEHDAAGPAFMPCGSRLRYRLAVTGRLSLPAAGIVELGVIPAQANDLADAAGHYTVTGVSPAGMTAPGDCPDPASAPK